MDHAGAVRMLEARTIVHQLQLLPDGRGGAVESGRPA
jgi:hypothetical protein